MEKFYVCLPGYPTAGGFSLGASMPVSCRTSFQAGRRGRSACLEYRSNVLVYNSLGLLVARYVYNRFTGSARAALQAVPRERRALSPAGRRLVCWESRA